MSDRDAKLRRELAALAYLDAFEQGDLDALGAVWEQAAGDRELERILCELVEGLAEEQEPSPGWHGDAEKVRALLKAKLPSAEPPEPVSGRLTAGDVAARIAGDAALLGKLPPEAREANGKLLGDRTPLPGALSANDLTRWADTLPVKADPRYWRMFRHVAVLLAMGRGGGLDATLAAAREGDSGGGGGDRARRPKEQGKGRPQS